MNAKTVNDGTMRANIVKSATGTHILVGFIRKHHVNELTMKVREEDARQVRIDAQYCYS